MEKEEDKKGQFSLALEPFLFMVDISHMRMVFMGLKPTVWVGFQYTLVLGLVSLLVTTMKVSSTYLSQSLGVRLGGSCYNVRNCTVKSNK